MSRRAGKHDAAFGSDSFLDIVANIVGILIILIVIAGVRVSHAPVEREARAPENLISSAHRGETSLAPNDEEITGTSAQRTAVSPAPVEAPARKLLQRTAELKTDIAALKQQEAELTERLKGIESRHEELRGRLASESAGFDKQTDALLKGERALEQLRQTLEFKRRKRRLLQSQLESAERVEIPVKTIEHKLTPVSRLVDDEEMHFRVAEGEVAFVPIDDLIERLRTQVRRQKDWLVKFRRHQGVVGPVGGFTMHYIVEREQLSVVEELRSGYGTMRIGVSEWQIKPGPTLRTESVEEALRPGSAFLRAVYQADPQTTLTFWVYPDSFGAFRRLQEFAHEEGFVVAARPLPFGVPIAGSPRGTRSAGQ